MLITDCVIFSLQQHTTIALSISYNVQTVITRHMGISLIKVLGPNWQKIHHTQERISRFCAIMVCWVYV